MRVRPEWRGFKKIWIYLVGLAVSVTVILLFFRLHPATENPPFP